MIENGLGRENRGLPSNLSQEKREQSSTKRYHIQRVFKMSAMTPTTSSRFVTTMERKYGRNALPNMFDAKAKEQPSARPYAYVLKTPNPADGFEKVTYTMLANAVNRASWWLVNEVAVAEGEVFGYMGPSDLRYLILSLASAKTGRRVCSYHIYSDLVWYIFIDTDVPHDIDNATVVEKHNFGTENPLRAHKCQHHPIRRRIEEKPTTII